MSVPEFETDGWPVLKVRFGAKLHPSDLDPFFAQALEALGRRQRFALVIDARLADVPDARTRERFIEFFTTHAALTQRYVRGMGVVMNTALGRGVITTLLWARATDFPVKTFASMMEATRWAEELP